MEALHVARVRHDWNGEGSLDLVVRQDDRVEIIRVKNNPGGKWLARSLNGNCEFRLHTETFQLLPAAFLLRWTDDIFQARTPSAVDAT